MSKENVKKLFGDMENNPELFKKYSTLMQEHHNETEKILSEKLIDFGKKSGFEFSKADLIAARAELLDGRNSNRELSDDDMERVAGGGEKKCFAIGISIATAGTVCALISVIGALVNKDAADPKSCQSTMTTRDANCKNE